MSKAAPPTSSNEYLCTHEWLHVDTYARFFVAICVHDHSIAKYSGSVTISCMHRRYHWDLPQVLQEKYGGWLSPQSQHDYLYYADAVFKHLGDLVDQWMTFNEVISICELGYEQSTFAPAVSVHAACVDSCAAYSDVEQEANYNSRGMFGFHLRLSFHYLPTICVAF